MTLQTFALVADVPADQAVAAQAAAASAVQSFAADVDGVTLVSATFGGQSLLPSPAEEWQNAVDALDALKTGRPTAAEVAKAVDRVQTAARAYELSLTVPAGTGAGTVAAAPADTSGNVAVTTVSLPAEDAPPAPAPAAPAPAPSAPEAPAQPTPAPSAPEAPAEAHPGA